LRKTLFVAGLVLTTIHAQGQTRQQAKDFLEGIYSWDTNIDADDLLSDAKTYTHSLISLFKQDQQRAGKGNIGKLDFDPLCSCQDPGGLKFSIVTLKPSPDKSMTAHIKLDGAPEGSVLLDLDLKWTRQGWRIDDTHSADVRSLRAFLTQH